MVEKINDLLKILFKGYAACSDKVFVKYVARKQEGYDEVIDILPENLMHLDVQKFKLLKTTNKCNAP